MIIFMENKGKGTNNRDEGLELRELLNLSLDEDIKDFYGYGDSKLRVEFMKGGKFLHNINPQGIGNNLKNLARSFNSFQICHILQEQNDSTNS